MCCGRPIGSWTNSMLARRNPSQHRASQSSREPAPCVCGPGFGEGSARPRTSESRSNQPRAPRATPRTDVLRVSPAPHAATRCLDHDLGGGSSRYLDNSLAFHSSAHPRERPRGALAGSPLYVCLSARSKPGASEPPQPQSTAHGRALSFPNLRHAWREHMCECSLHHSPHFAWRHLLAEIREHLCRRASSDS